MAIEFVGGTSAGNDSGAGTYSVSLTSLTGGLSSSPQEGDIVIVAFGHAENVNRDLTINTAGYTELADLYSNDNNDANLSINYKIMGSTPDTSISVDGSGAANIGAACVVHVWRGVDTSTPIDVTTTTATGSNGAIPNAPSITPVTPGAVIVLVGAGAIASNEVPGSYGTISGTTKAIATFSNTPGADLQLTIAAYESWTSGAYDPVAWPQGSADSSAKDSWVAASIALRPGSTTQDETRNSTGSIAYSGAAGKYVIRTRTASGNVAFSGTASPPKRTALKDASGSINYTGTASKTKSAYKSPSGSVSFSGLAGVSFEGVTAATWYATGSIAFNGAASRARKLNKNTSGSVNFTGLAVKYKSLTYTPDGSIVFGGDSSYVIPTTYTFKSTGGKVYFSGNVSKYKHKNFGTLGGLDFLSAAIISANRAGASVWSADLNAGAAESVALTVNIWDGTVEEAVGSQVSSPNVWGKLS